MANNMENYNDISCDIGQIKTDWRYVWWSTISVVTLDKIKIMAVSMENYNYITFDIGKDKTDWHSVWWVTISVLTRDKIKINGNQSGELQYQY